MKPIAPALFAISAATLIVLAIAALADGPAGTSRVGFAEPVGTYCDTPSDPCWPGNPTPTPGAPGGMDAMAIDMDPSSAPANTATSIGSREFCARINENDLLDADEDAVDTLEIDVTTGPLGVPEEHPMIAFTFELRYSALDFRIEANDVNMLMAAGPGSNILNVSDPLPDVNGTLHVAAADVNTVAESGPGVLTRVRIASTTAAGSGISHLLLQNAGHIDPDNQAFAPHGLNQAIAAIDVQCPAEQPEPVPPPGPTPGPPETPTVTPTLAPPSEISGMDAMSIDMDPSAAPANTATTIGSREFCARINENDLLDADEIAIDTLQLDVMTGPAGIPEGNPMYRFAFVLLYDSEVLTVASNDVAFLLDTLKSGFLFNASDPVPDSDGRFVSHAEDTRRGAVAGPGVLSRMSIATHAGAASGIHHLIVDPDASAHFDVQNQVHAPRHFDHGVVAVGQGCPLVQPPIPLPPPPPNDDFAFAETISTNSHVFGIGYLDRTLTATVEEDEPLPCGGIGRTVWYRFGVRPDERRARVTAPNAKFDQVIAAHTGSALSDLSLIDCVVFDSPSASMEVTIPAGQTVYVQVGGKNGADGIINFELDDITPTTTPTPPGAATPTPTPAGTPTPGATTTPTESPVIAAESPTITPAGPPKAGGGEAGSGGPDAIPFALAGFGVAVVSVFVLGRAVRSTEQGGKRR